ncbi:hypothetical protein Tco_1025986 [Tanacetum coccineum]
MIGDQVFCFNSRLKIFFGKLKSRWSGPFIITEVYLYGTAKLSHADGSNFKGSSRAANDDQKNALVRSPHDRPNKFFEASQPVIPLPSTDITTTGARIIVWLQASISLPPEAEVERLLAMPTPPPSPPISLSPPSTWECLVRCMALPAHSSPPSVPSPLLPSSGCPTQIQTLRIAFTHALVDTVTAVLPSPPLPPLPSSLYIPPHVDRRDDIPESERPPHKRSCFFALGSRYEVGESSTARPTEGRGVDYRDTWVDPAEAVPEIAPMTVREVNTKVTELDEIHEHDIQDLYALLKDAQDSRTRIS